MAKKKFDVYQKKAVETKLNSVVSAGAGSGKTTVLSHRFLELIKTGMNVDEILTLTFTKKATVEMSSRIYKVLEKDAPEQAANHPAAVRLERRNLPRQRAAPGGGYAPSAVPSSGAPRKCGSSVRTAWSCS